VQYDGGQSERNRRDETNREQRPHAAEYNVSTSFALVLALAEDLEQQLGAGL
jgi:hypothetical protein